MSAFQPLSDPVDEFRRLCALSLSLPLSRFLDQDPMSYENVVGGKLKLKGKALDVKSGGAKKKRKKVNLHLEQFPITNDEDIPSSVATEGSEIVTQEVNDGDHAGNDEIRPPMEDHRTAAEKRYHEQRLRLQARQLAKSSSKSHRDRIEDFNQYLANLSEHYDIPKVGPG